MALVDGGTGEDVERIWVGGFDAGLNFKISGGGDHGGVVAGEFRFREEAVGEFFGGFFAEKAIRGNATGEHNRFSVWIHF